MIKHLGFILAATLSTSAASAFNMEDSELKAMLSSTVMEGRLAHADKEIAPPIFAEKPVVKVQKVEAPVEVQISENDVEGDDDVFMLDEE